MAVARYWTPAREARLKKYWAQGHTADAIAIKLDRDINLAEQLAGLRVTKNMVIGKVRRLQLPYRRGHQPALFAPEPKQRPPQNAPRIRARIDRRPRKGISPAPKAHPLVRVLIAEMNAQRCSWTDMARRTGLSVQTFTSWRTVNTPTLTGLEACFNVLGKTLQPVEIEE